MFIIVLMHHPKYEIIFRRGTINIQIPLIKDNAPGHSEYVIYENENTEAIFLPQNTTTLL